MDPSKNVGWTKQMIFEIGYLITADTNIVTSPDGKGVILIGVGDDNNQPTTTLLEWSATWNEELNDFDWNYINMSQTLNVARKGSVVVPVSDKWTSCSKYLVWVSSI